MNLIEELKTCSKCKVEKSIQNFYLRKKGKFKGEFFSWCKDCCSREYQCWKKNNKKRISDNEKKRYRIISKKEPWRITWKGMIARCNSTSPNAYPYYRSKGIIRMMSSEDTKFVWFRDKAYLLKRPTLHRIDSDGNYAINNCKFIELGENARLATQQRLRNRLRKQSAEFWNWKQAKIFHVKWQKTAERENETKNHKTPC